MAACEPAWLVQHFGEHQGRWLHRAANGQDERPVVTHSEPVSMSRETTFDRDLHARRDRDQLSAVFTELCVRVADDLQRKGYVGRTVGIKLRFDDFRIQTRDLTLPLPTADAATIRRAAGLCLKRADLSRRLRLLGVRVASLESASQFTGLSTGLRQAPEAGAGKAPRTAGGALHSVRSEKAEAGRQASPLAANPANLDLFDALPAMLPPQSRPTRG